MFDLVNDTNSVYIEFLTLVTRLGLQGNLKGMNIKVVQQQNKTKPDSLACSGLCDELPRSPASGGLVPPVARDARATSVVVICSPGEADTQWQINEVSGHDQDLGILTQLGASLELPVQFLSLLILRSSLPFQGLIPSTLCETLNAQLHGRVCFLETSLQVRHLKY